MNDAATNVANRDIVAKIVFTAEIGAVTKLTTDQLKTTVSPFGAGPFNITWFFWNLRTFSTV